jgi:hypothetical protein
LGHREWRQPEVVREHESAIVNKKKTHVTHIIIDFVRTSLFGMLSSCQTCHPLVFARLRYEAKFGRSRKRTSPIMHPDAWFAIKIFFLFF